MEYIAKVQEIGSKYPSTLVYKKEDIAEYYTYFL